MAEKQLVTNRRLNREQLDFIKRKLQEIRHEKVAAIAARYRKTTKARISARVDSCCSYRVTVDITPKIKASHLDLARLAAGCVAEACCGRFMDDSRRTAFSLTFQNAKADIANSKWPLNAAGRRLVAAAERKSREIYAAVYADIMAFDAVYRDAEAASILGSHEAAACLEKLASYKT